jgi:pimeloyl-ACP methyl ester carboxylesterase
MLRIRRTLITSGAVLMFLVLAGATYQGVATALERRQFRYPGRMVPTGAHQLHIYCRGMGSPTVVLEAPATGLSAAWGWVQPAVAARTRTCSYDRAGLGWSEMDDRPYDPAAVPGELHTLLQNAGEHSPFVLAGQGLGAAFAKVYASKFRDEVEAIVLVDPPDDDSNAPQLNQMMRLVNVSPWLARTGVLRATRMLSNNASGMPDPAGSALSSFLNRPDHLTRAARELARWDDAVRLAEEATLSPSLHVTRIEAEHDRVALLANREQAARVTASILSAVDTVRTERIKRKRR